MSLVTETRELYDLRDTLLDEFGMHQYTVTIRTETWSGGYVGQGTATTSDTLLDPTPDVEANKGNNARSWLGGGVLLTANGTMELAGYRVGPIAKPYTGGGHSLAQLAPPITAANKRTMVVLAGDGFVSGGEPFNVMAVDAQDPWVWYLYLERKPTSGKV